jgi:plastocyanin
MKRTRIGVALCGLALVVAACGGSTGGASTPSTSPSAPTTNSSSSATAPKEAKIVIRGFAYSPTNLSVSVGTKVTVTNEDSTTHTWTADDGQFDSGDLGQGRSFSFTFAKAGSFGYHCSIHPFMKGVVNVS